MKDNENISNLFIQLISQLNRGRTLNDLAEAQTALVEAIKETGKKGELCIKLEFKPVPQSGASQLTIIDTISTKMPKKERCASLFFTCEDNTLSRNAPNQMDMFSEFKTDQAPESYPVEQETINS